MVEAHEALEGFSACSKGNRPIHPVHYWIEHYLKPLEVPYGGLNASIRVEGPLAEALALWYGTSEDFWWGMQWNFDRWAASEGLTAWQAGERAQYEYELGLENRLVSY